MLRLHWFRFVVYSTGYFGWGDRDAAWSGGSVGIPVV